jgi:hypothetical protein
LGIVRAWGPAPRRVGAGLPCPATAAHTAPRAPTGPPLTSSTSTPTAGQSAGEEGEALAGADASASAATSGGDPLVENGLGSPLCGEAGALAAAARRNCTTSGFEAAGAPTGNYALDVHIDATPLDFSLDLDAVLQDYMVEPVWLGLVWVIHTLIVALEWCFTPNRS